jgi:hypothetical protein
VPEKNENRTQMHPLNRLAYSVYYNMSIKINGRTVGKPLRIEINPLMLKVNSAGALYDESKSRLTLAQSNVDLATIDDMVIHEIRHGFDFYRQANGHDHVWTAFVYFAESTPQIHETYPHAFSVDELAAYVKQVTAQIRAAARETKMIDYALDFAKTGLVLTNALLRPQVLPGCQRIIESLIQNSKNWGAPRWSEIKIDEEPQKVWLYKLPQTQARIYFYETYLLDSQKTEVPIKITHAVIENGDFKIDMNSLIPLQTQNIDPLLKQISQKLSELHTKADLIQQNLSKTVERLEAGDRTLALQAIERALAAIAIP